MDNMNTNEKEIIINQIISDLEKLRENGNFSVNISELIIWMKFKYLGG